MAADYLEEFDFVEYHRSIGRVDFLQTPCLSLPKKLSFLQRHLILMRKVLVRFGAVYIFVVTQTYCAFLVLFDQLHSLLFITQMT